MPASQVVTADGVDMGNGLPAISFDEAMKLAADPAATAAYYKPWTRHADGRHAGGQAGADRRRSRSDALAHMRLLEEGDRRTALVF